MSAPLPLDWVTDANRAFINARRFLNHYNVGSLTGDLREMARRYDALAARCRALAAEVGEPAA